jgi:outer membrane protein OmpA-like peptidoglycan-associated protein
MFFGKHLTNIINMNTFRFLLLSVFGVVGIQVYAQTPSVIPTSPTEWGSQSLKLSPENTLNNGFFQYDMLGDFGMENCAWVLLVAPYDGVLSIAAPVSKDPYEMATFRAETTDYAQELKSANAFLLGAQKIALGKALNLDSNTDPDNFDAALFEIMKGQSVLIFVNSIKGKEVNFNTELKRNASIEPRKLLIPFEYRKTPASKSLKVVVRDAVTGLPVKARINVQGLKGIDNVYNASDFTFDLVTSKVASMSCDAPGYFNRDIELKLTAGVNNVVTVKLSPLSSNENMRLDGVQFKEGTAEPLPSAFQELNKLVDFMRQNPKIQIEIQGHVNAPNNESRAAQKLSEKRAKVVYDYLVEKGIDPKRMTFVGYGNSAMIFVDPKNDEEERANRRVEIKILD